MLFRTLSSYMRPNLRSNERMLRMDDTSQQSAMPASSILIVSQEGMKSGMVNHVYNTKPLVFWGMVAFPRGRGVLGGRRRSASMRSWREKLGCTGEPY
jgi:hypothetical protein